jgi:hypothetical protein
MNEWLLEKLKLDGEVGFDDVHEISENDVGGSAYGPIGSPKLIASSKGLNFTKFVESIDDTLTVTEELGMYVVVRQLEPVMNVSVTVDQEDRVIYFFPNEILESHDLKQKLVAYSETKLENTRYKFDRISKSYQEGFVLGVSLLGLSFAGVGLTNLGLDAATSMTQVSQGYEVTEVLQMNEEIGQSIFAAGIWNLGFNKLAKKFNRGAYKTKKESAATLSGFATGYFGMDALTKVMSEPLVQKLSEAYFP